MSRSSNSRGGSTPAKPGAAAALLASAALAHPLHDPILPFTEEALLRGVVHQIQPYPPTVYRGFGFGMAVADLDGDGHLDLVLLGRSNGRIGLFQNDGTGHFINHSLAENGLWPAVRASVVLAFDYDGDGRPDLFVGEYLGQNRLYRNLGEFTFVETTEVAGLGGTFATKGASVADFDGDGWLDLHVCNFWEPIPEQRRNRLYRNRGDGTFEEVAAAHGLDLPHASLQSVFSDFDRDGWPDLYVSNDRGHLLWPNQLFRNDHGAFIEVSKGSGADVALFSMGVACGDLDGDGFPDFYLTNLQAPMPPLHGANPLLLGSAEGIFQQSQETWGVAHHLDSWGATFWDFDNDGHLDLHVNNQWVANTLYRNPGAPPMVNATAAAALAGTPQPSYASVVGDLTGNGALDLVQNNYGGNVRIYINREGARRRSFRLRIAGEGRHADAIGASATLRVGARTQWREVLLGGNGYLGQNELTLHFGVGDALRVDEIEVRWPAGGPIRILRDLPSGVAWTAYPPSRLGDADGDGTIGADDLARLCEWVGAPIEPGREMMDFDGDGFIGPADVELFWLAAAARPGSIRRGDLDGDGRVDAADLALLLAAWGSGECIADLDLDGVVGPADLAGLLAAWDPPPRR